MALKNILHSVVNNKCPKCHQGKVFSKNSAYDLKNLFKMEQVCDHCGERYEKEPGYFYGAMFVSYALSAIVFFIFLVLDFTFLHLGLSLLLILIPAVLIFSPVTFRWSRLIWLNLFIKYDPSIAVRKSK